jgi:hypothetical protein
MVALRIVAVCRQGGAGESVVPLKGKRFVSRPPVTLGGVVDDCDRIDLDQVAGGHRRYPDHYVCRFVISEQGYLGRFDDRHVFVALVVDDIDGDLSDLLRPGAGSCKRTAEIAKRQARLGHKITMANELAVYVLGLLARDKYQLASRRDEDLAVHFWNCKILGIDALKHHRMGLLLWVAKRKASRTPRSSFSAKSTENEWGGLNATPSSNISMQGGCAMSSRRPQPA